MAHILPLAASAMAQAAPAAAATAAKATLMTTLKTVALKALTQVAITAAMTAMQPQVGFGGRTFEWVIDPDGPIPFAAGRVGVPGSVIHKATFGPDLMYYGVPAVLSGAGPIDGIDSVKADDELVTFDANGKAVSSQYANELWFKAKLGAQPDTAITSPSGLKNSAALPGWTSAHKLSGLAGYMLVMGENSKGTAFPTGEVKPTITFRGLKVYDPRLDSTYPGGSGSHRLADPATWTYSQNPILWGLKWALGLWAGPTGKGAPQVDYQVGGIGAKPAGIDFPALVAAANVADANDWTCSAYPNTDDDKHQVLSAFLQAGGAIYAQRAGKISCIQRAAPRTSIVTISAADTAGPLEIDTAASRIDRINTLRPRYWSEAHRWQMTAMSEVSPAAYVAEDGAKRTRGLDFPYVNNARQAGQLAALQIANTREGVAGVIPLKPHLQRIRPGDAFTITEEGFVLNGLKCLCLNTEYDAATGIVRVTFVSETDGKYPFALGLDPDPPAPQVLDPVDPTFVTAPSSGDWEIVPREPTEDGVQLPVWDLVGEVTNSTATAVIVEWGAVPEEGEPLDGIAWNEAYFGSPTATRIPIQGMQPGGTYYVAVRHVRGSNFSLRTLYGPEVVPALVALTSEDAEALDRLDRIDSDGWLTKGEKPAVLAQYQTAVGEYAGLAARLTAAGLSTDLAAYSGAKTTLDAYIDALSPDLDDFDEDTAIVGEDLRYAFEMYFYARQTAINALLADARTRADAAAASADAALDDIDVIVSDAWLSRNEKPRIIEQFAVIQNETTALRDQAEAFGALTQRTAYIAAYDALVAYLASLSPAWNSLSVDTPVVGVDLRYAFEIYYLRRQEMLTAQMGITDADAAEALSRLAIIDADGWLSKGEKPQVVREYEAVIAQFGPLRDQAAAVGATTERTALIAAVDALNAYLAGLSPLWSDTATDTAIVSATFRARFTAYYEAAQITQSAIASAVGEDGAEAMARLAVIDSDNWLSKGEKSDVIRVWQALDGEFASLNAQAVALGITDPLYAYFEALTDLGLYLDGLSPDWDNTAVDTPIVGTTFRANFNAVYLARTALQNAMVDALDDAIGIIVDRLDDIASDNILSRNEKPEIIRQYSTIAAEKPGVVARLAAVGVSSTAYVAAFDALTSYLGGLSPAWNDLAQNTPITGSTFRQKFVDYYVARSAADDATIVEVGADVATALAALDVIASDGFLSRGEKPAVIQQWATITGETGALRDQAEALGITGPRTAYVAAHDALGSYLGGLTPDWDDLTVDTPIVGTTLRARFEAYYVAKQALMNAISDKLNIDIGLIGADAAEALAALIIIASDNWLSTGEKATLIREVANLNADVTSLTIRAAALGITTELTTFSSKVAALNSYLSSLTPAWDNVSVDTAIDGPTLRFVLYDAYETKQALLNAFDAAIDANADAAHADLAIIYSDNWLSRTEKPTVIREHATLNGDYSGLATRAANLGVTTELTAHADAINALNSYLGGLSPAWNSLSVDSPMTGATLRSRFEAAYATKQTLLNAFTAVLDSNVDAANADLAIIASDNWLSRSEKPEVKRQYETLNAEFPGLNDQAVDLGITTPLYAYYDALTALGSYLSGLSPAWDNFSVDTPMTGSTLRSRFQTVYNTKTALQSAIVAAGSATAQWVCKPANPSRTGGTVGGSGSVTSNSLTFVNTNAPGSVSIAWTQVFGETVSVSGGSTGPWTWSVTPPAGVVTYYRTIWHWTATSGGQTRDGEVFVTLWRDM